MHPLYKTKFGNYNSWWNNRQLVEAAEVRTLKEAFEYVYDRNEGHDLFYFIDGSVVEGYVQEILDDEILMTSGGPFGDPDDVFPIPFDQVDLDLLIYWPKDGHPVRVDFTFTDNSEPSGR